MAFRQVKRDLKSLQASLTDINAQLTQQHDIIVDHARLIHNHAVRLDGLEEIVRLLQQF